MAESRAAWGIDIGQSALKAIKVRYIESAGQVVAEAFDYVPFPKILSQPDAIPEEIVPQAMETFLGRNNLKGDLVGISVPGQSALARFIQLPPVEVGKLHEIVKYEAKQQIPFDLDDVIWDYQPLGAGAEQSGFLLDAEVGLFAMKKDQIAQQMRPYNDAKVEVELIQVAPLALYNMLSFDELGIRRDTEGEAGEDYYIILDMGCDNTTLIVTNGYSVWIRNVPIGGNHFTRALTKEMKLSFAKAEHLKCNATKSPDPRAVFQALRPVFNDYVSEIQRSVGYFSSVKRSARIAKVVGLGNGFKLAGLQKFLQQNLQYEVDRPDSFRSLAGDSVVNAPLFSDNILSFAVPYGLSLQALKLSRIKTTLLPPEISTARIIKRKKPWAVAAAASLLAGYMLSTVGNAYTNGVVHTPEFADAEQKAGEVNGQYTALKSAYSTQVTRHGAAEEKLKNLISDRRDVHWLEVYSAVADCLPRMPEGQELPEEINLKPLITITEFSSERLADVSTWHAKIPEGQQEYFAEDERETPPTGPGYVFTIGGKHYYDNPDEPFNAGVIFVKNTFLKNLQQQQIQQPTFPVRDLRRMGLHHAVIVEQTNAPQLKIGPDVKNVTAPTRVLGKGAGGGGGPMGPGTLSTGGAAYPGTEGYSEGGAGYPGAGYPGGTGPMGPGGPGGASGEGVKVYEGTAFKIQFVLQYIPPEERAAIVTDEPTVQEGAAPVEAADATTPPAAP
ncbi:MAG: type IV pilus assembly protein PilM [Planctomycetaceae bacterium]|nr:type IV pilus assembly protein PilM [Planctomycetaceae bacterium]MCB9952365.1 type IV pilus assembly protein PilM [Planctomycetaceae bacterium]